MANINPYLTFSSPSSFTLATANSDKNWDGSLEYSTDLENWNTWDGVTTLNSSDDAEHVLYMRGTGNSRISDTYIKDYRPKRWVLTGSHISCMGNIENLLDYEKVSAGEHPEMANNCYDEMFYDCTSLIEAPELPAITLTESCYANMFYNCTSLTIAPELPATTLAKSCYAHMFSGCASLITAPELLATTIAEMCYYGMFSGCASLITPPELPATMLAKMCYDGMFWGCTNIKLSATEIGKYNTPYRIPSSDTGVIATDALTSMFTGTGGIFTGTPEINTTYYLYTIPKYVDSINLRGSIKYLKHSNLANDLNAASSNSIPTVKAIRDYREFTTEQYNAIANLLNLSSSSGTVNYITPTDDVVVDIELNDLVYTNNGTGNPVTESVLELSEKLLNITHKEIINDITVAEDNNELVTSKATKEFLSLTNEQYNTLIGIING